MPKLYKQNCKQCGKYYERPGAKYFCCLYCANTNKDRIKKISIANTGKIRSEESKKRMSLLQMGNQHTLGHKLSEEHKKKIGDAQRGIPRSEESKLKLSETRKRLFREGKLSFVKPYWGTKHSKDTIQKIIETRKANYKKENHYNWKGGISKNPYPQEFNKELKRKIKERDNYTCQLCYKTEQEEMEELNRVLCVNHIDFNKNNCSPNNLNTLCVRCNVKINYNREKFTLYFQGVMNYV